MANNKVQLADGTTLMDISDSTVTEDAMLEGTVAYNAAGDQIVGTMRSPTTLINSIIDRSITSITRNTAKVGEYAFAGCKLLETASFPLAETIGYNAFQMCPSLKTVDLPVVKNIYDSSFDSCQVLETASFPLAETIGYSAFRMCSSLKTVDLPVVKNIQDYAFVECNALKTVIIRTSEICVLDSYIAFTETPIESGTGYIYVPAAMVDSYKAATNWTTYADQIRAIEDYPDICGGTT